MNQNECAHCKKKTALYEYDPGESLCLRCCVKKNDDELYTTLGLGDSDRGFIEGLFMQIKENLLLGKDNKPSDLPPAWEKTFRDHFWDIVSK
jgi:hypothetical protein